LGVMVAANDGWNEQIVKRRWTSHGLPDVLTPNLSVGWAILIAATVVLSLVAFRVRPAPPRASAAPRSGCGRRRPAPLARARGLRHDAPGMSDRIDPVLVHAAESAVF